MKGFFTKREYVGLHEKVLSTPANKGPSTRHPCGSCTLHKTCQSPKMEFTGNGKKGILILGEGPGKDEDQNWKELGYEVPTQFIGQAGQYLRSKTSAYDIDIDEDCWLINSVNCRTPNNRAPTKKEVKCCKPRINKAIAELNPKFIWLLGASALESFYGDRFSNCSIGLWRNLCIPDRETNAWVLPMFHPSYILRKEDENLDSVYDRDFDFAIDCLEKERPEFEDFVSKVAVLTSYDLVVRNLELIIKKKLRIAIDYETSAIKPYGLEHKIWTIGISTGKRTFAFPYQYPYWTEEEFKQIRNLWKTILASDDIEKIAHNMKFEDLWSRNICRIRPKGWIACTMTNAHILNNRRGFVGLKFQSYIRYGIEGYGKSLDKFMKTNHPGTDVNTLDEAPLGELLLYNGLDAKLTYQLFEDQEKEFEGQEGLLRAKDLFHEGLITLANSQQNGIPVDDIYYLEQDESLTEKIAKVEQQITTSDEAKLFRKKTGRYLTIKAKDYSAVDLRILFFDILKLKSGKETATKLKSVDEEVLNKLKHPLAKLIIKRRKLSKIKGTYIGQFKRESYQGKLHPFFDLHTTDSYRSSSSSPNFQNIPTRDEEAKAIVRKGIYPSPGNQILCADYGGHEFRIITCVTQDPAMIEYVENDGDPHADYAKKIFQLNDKQLTGDIRFYIKNGFIFPVIYGSWFRACASDLWENCRDLKTGEGVKVTKHLVDKGILRTQKDYRSFERHVKNVEKEFWEKFHVTKEKQQKAIKDYRETGYIEMFTGFRRYGHLSTNMIRNTPVQGPAFHCLLWSMNKIDRIADRRWKTKLMGQIHDEILFDLVPEEEEEVLLTTKRIMETDIRKAWDWIIVPLSVEFEITGINESWYYKKEIII